MGCRQTQAYHARTGFNPGFPREALVSMSLRPPSGFREVVPRFHPERQGKPM
jgi:hypothetical protein